MYGWTGGGGYRNRDEGHGSNILIRYVVSTVLANLNTGLWSAVLFRY